MGSTLKRTKRRILVSIVVLPDEEVLAGEAVEDAYRYADEVHVIQAGRSTPSRAFAAMSSFVHAIPVSMTSPRDRSLAYRSVWPTREYPADVVIMFLEVGYRVSDADAVRTSIEFNPGKVITAMRYFQWDLDFYRVDGRYRPARLPVAASAKQGVHWVSPVQTVPDWMWSSRDAWVEASFDIVDVTFMDAGHRWDDGQPKLEAMPGRVYG
jgi:hypothetical protein